MKDLTGMVFGNLTAIKIHKNEKGKSPIWECKCLCGNTTRSSSGDLFRKKRPTRMCKCCSRRKMWNPIFENGVCKIPIKPNLFSIIDQEDYEIVKGYKWYIIGNGYVGTEERSWKGGGKIHLSKLILGVGGRQIVDHINRNPLDNRRSNLRKVSASENNINRDIMKSSSVGVPGVTRVGKKFRVRISINRKRFHIGNFSSIEDAKRAREDAEVKFHKGIRYSGNPYVISK